MLAAASLAKLALPVLGVVLLASGAKKSTAPQTMSGMLLVAPNGVVVVNPTSAAWVMQGLATQSATPIAGSQINQATLSQTPQANAPNALAWAQGQAAQGKIVLLGIEGNNSLAAVAPGQEVSIAQASAHRWAVLLEPPGASALPGGQPALPGVPGGVPGTPGAPGAPGAPSGPGLTIPGLGYIPLPTFQPGTQPPSSPSSPSSPGQPSAPGQTAPAGYVPGANGAPGSINIPGLGSFQVPNLNQPAPAPGGDGPPLPSSTDPGQPPPPGTIPVPGLGNVPNPFPGLLNLPNPLTPTPATPGGNGAGTRPPGATVWLGSDGRYRYAIRSGDIASRMAQWFTGNALRWRELETVNPDLRLVTQNNQPYGYSPWRLDQVLVLPPGWDGSKGPQIQTVSAGVGIAVGAY